MLPLSLMLVLGLFLLFPSFTRAGDPDDELRIIDLELRMLSLERAAINARIREADRERAQRNADLERDLSSYPNSVYPSSVFELDHITVLDPEPLFPTMRPPWLQPADRLAPMPEEQRMRMWCAAPTDCWLNPMP
jgi:hypothetical protein